MGSSRVSMYYTLYFFGILFLCFNSEVYASQGSITITGNDLSIQIPNLLGSIVIQSTSSATPYFTYNAPNINNAYTKQGNTYVFDNYDHTTVTTNNPQTTTSSSSTGQTTGTTGLSPTSTSTSTGLSGSTTSEHLSAGNTVSPNFKILVLVFGVLVFFLGNTNGISTRFSFVLMCTIFIVLFLSSVPVQVAADPSPLVTVTLYVPTTYAFSTFQLYAPFSSIQSTVDAKIITNLLSIYPCGLSSSNVNFQGSVFVYDSALVCVSGNAVFNSLRAASTQVNINITSLTGDVQTSFLSGYFGNFAVNSSTTPTISGNCQVFSGAQNSHFGNCGPTQYSNAVFNSLSGSVNVDFGSGCASDWLGDPAAKDVFPASGQILNYVQPFVINVSTADPTSWSYYTPFGQRNGYSSACPGATGCTSADVGAAQVYQPSWSNQPPFSWYTLPNRVLPSIMQGYSYTIQFDVRMDTRNLVNNRAGYSPSNFSVVFFENYDSVWHAAESQWYYWIADDAYTDPTYSLGYCYVDPTLINSTTYHTLSCTITPSRSSDNVVVGLRAYDPDYNTGDQWYYFKNLLVHIPSTPVRTPSLLTKDSENVQLRYPSPNFDPNPRGVADCPHMQQGLKFWHDPSIWPGNVVPSPSKNVTLPANTNVLISSCSLQSGTYQRIYIPSTSSLIFDDAPITLNVRDIYVEGKLQIGSPTCRLFSEITITFHGINTTSDTIAPTFGSKGIGVAATGQLDIHGKQYHKTWARIADSAKGGDDRVYLMDDVNWEVGQQIVVTATILIDETYNQNEIVTITAIQSLSPGRTVVVFTPPLQYYHYGEQEYQAEVGLLTRRITLRGSFDDSEANNASFGGHVMVKGQARYSGVIFTRMGQLNRLARYPVHWHLVRDGGANSFVRDSTFYHNFYRCVSVHGTNNVTVTRNVGFDIMGHCYYLEDGTEENNELSYNLGAFIHTIGRPIVGYAQVGEFLFETSDLRNPADSGAAAFYITNAYNRIIGNAATGGWTGFSFPNLYRPIQLDAWQAPFNPSGRPTLEFDGNTARGSGNFFGNSGCFYVGGHLYHTDPNNIYGENDDDNTGTTPLGYQNGRVERTTCWQNMTNFADPNCPAANLTFTNIKASLCSMGVGDWSSLQVSMYESHDNFRSAMMFGQSWLDNALVVGRTQNPLSGTPPLVQHQFFQLYDTYTMTILTNIVVRNFLPIPGLKETDQNPDDDNTMIVCLHQSDVFKPEGMSASRNITFQNIDPSILIGVGVEDSGSSRMFNLYDTDGTIAPYGGLQTHGKPAIIGSYPTWWHFNDSCVFNATWNTWLCPKSVPQQQIITVGLYMDGLIDYGQNNRDGYDAHIGNISLFGNGIPRNEVRSIVFTRNAGITGMSHTNWFMTLNDPYGPPASIDMNTIQVPNNTWFIFATQYPVGTTFNIWSDDWSNIWLPGYYVFGQVDSFDKVLNGNGTVYFVDPDGILYVKVIDFSIKFADSFQNFYRGGAQINGYNNGFEYHIRATCPHMYTLDVQPGDSSPNNVVFCSGGDPTIRPRY
eukprot:TRINITY_DN7244_c0_g2_i1.p1 TRINITY_DN7244_c0_g2~~TRINITY_DN7244_c0_g2_i1.p1  ORF type:complete len:1528 (+),score=332.39 TRINITY_DN7244_c0_g2_i1:272-4855(+)